ncbi:sugar phosphate isomerase/epimerase [Sporolactobacillus sp. CPB3-1]|uniref:Sugar phosphate isomerase/epimerase n=1 Tax=Sporolactobacillus mangiferae TaxID=2940498 RepID=A0ABT0MAV6_9BACL|nr:sugar phosphate isomerase/epimerase family protein [Sporolactobacillus mangiferae]MCL1632006.1 sugar phosphate isomerase/epimerase [Sporolactobacillus mangiferae]
MYLSSTLCWANAVDEVMELADRYGFSGVEVWAEHIWYRGTDEAAIVAASERYHQELTLHAASWDLNLCALNVGVRRQSVHEVERSLELASRIGAGHVTVHPGRATLAHVPFSYAHWMNESFCYLAKRAEQLHVRLSIELMEQIPKELITTPEAINRLLSMLPSSVTATFDIAHVPMEEDIVRYYRRTSRVSKIHFSDSTVGCCHVPLGKGQLPIRSIMPFLESADVPIILEGFDLSPSHDVLHADLDFLQSLGTSVRRIPCENTCK